MHQIIKCISAKDSTIALGDVAVNSLTKWHREQ